MYLYSRYSSYRNFVKFTVAILLNYFLGTPYNLCITKINLWLIAFFLKLRLGLPLCKLLTTCLQFSYHCSLQQENVVIQPNVFPFTYELCQAKWSPPSLWLKRVQNTHLLTQFQVFFTMYRFLSLLFSWLLFSQTKLIEASSNVSPIDIGFCHLSTVFSILRR